jgi:fluoroacetyl-CoA thioesterase
MKEIFKAGDTKAFKAVVNPADVATFQGAIVHPVYSTFALARDVEWTTRQFVLEMKEGDEEAVGTFLLIRHQGPAFVGEEVTFTGMYDGLKNGELRCSFEARVGNRIIATGETGQRILKLEKIKSLFNHG